jgi:starch-binding outer membrane protein, SusD/RagB family
MKLLKRYILLLILTLSLGSCEKLLNPENDNHSTFDRVYKDPVFAQGVLDFAYTKIPTSSLSFNDVATDDAVSSDKTNSYLRMAKGEWSALYNPVSGWDNINAAIFSINKFLEIVDSVDWQPYNPALVPLYIRRFKGEAYGLRGYLEYHLLQTVAGEDNNGVLSGIPLYDEFIELGDNLNVPRATFEESVERIYADLDKSLEYLTMNDYTNITNVSQLPPDMAGTVMADYNTVFGNNSRQRISGRIVKAIKARVALLAASPAFSDDDPLKWAAAANYSATVINDNGGITGLDANGHRFFEKARVDAINLAGTPPVDQKEILYRTAVTNSSSREKANFPPTLFGNGNLNPTQNLVDAFPMANGYPITHGSSGYNAATPYTGRDPRLALYIIYNGSSFKGATIKTGLGGGNNAKDSIPTSTRTGYYLKKLLRDDVNVDPTATSAKKHYDVHIRYTEIFLNYAEAANEAWGPNGTGPNSYSARDIILAIRKRAGIAQPDNYVSSLITKDEIRALIHNERRLELCFEGFRFWDLRRWKEDLTITAKGVNINKAGTVFSIVDVEPRAYDNDYMIYGPLPQNEILKYNALIQNKGW